MKARGVWAVAAAVLAITSGTAVKPQHADAAAKQLSVYDQIDGYRGQTWHWQRVMGKPRTPSKYRRGSEGHRYAGWVLQLWHRRAIRARRQATRPPHLTSWLCIHRFEGGWSSATGNGFYGGLQMDLGFQLHYGRELLRRKGTADNWSPLEQMWVAERAHRAGRGFWPWPNTAAACGLL